LLSLDNIELEFSDTFLDGVVETAYNTKRGARALRSAIANRMTEVIYEINDESYGKKITI
jgi:ATP-dependent protease Clp ATPase subunit